MIILFRRLHLLLLRRIHLPMKLLLRVESVAVLRPNVIRVQDTVRFPSSPIPKRTILAIPALFILQLVAFNKFISLSVKRVWQSLRVLVCHLISCFPVFLYKLFTTFQEGWAF